MERAVVGLAVVVGACAGDERGDCRDDELSCAAPFTCVAPLPTDADQSKHHCSTRGQAAPSCMGSPAGQAVPFSTVGAESFTVHWTLAQGCIPITYQPQLAGKLGEINGALEALEAVTCSRLCFEEPAPSDTLPSVERRERRIHLHTGIAPGGEPTNITNTMLFFEVSSGRSFAATIYVTQPEATTQGRLIAALLLAAGMTKPEPHVSSTLSDDVTVPQEPTTADQEALCRLYGQPSFCGD